LAAGNTGRHDGRILDGDPDPLPRRRNNKAILYAHRVSIFCGWSWLNSPVRGGGRINSEWRSFSSRCDIEYRMAFVLD
jgi:hypothetical protein